MLTRMLAVFSALAVIGFAVAVAPSPAVAQTGGDSTAPAPATATATATATPTATPTPAPGPESFALTPHIGNLEPRGLTRLGNKWYVGGIASLTTDRNIHVFSDAGTYERSLRVEGGSGLEGGASVYNGGLVRGLTTDGTKIIAVTAGAPPWVYEWEPQTNGASVPTYSVAMRLPTPPEGGQYRVDGIAHDGTDLWVAASWPRSGANRLSKHGLLKVNPTGDTLYQVNKMVDALARENGYLYALSKDEPSDLLRIKVGEGSTLLPYDAAAAGTQMNDWEVVRRSVGIRGGLALRNGVAYGFNSARDEVRQARQPSAERLFSLTPSIGNLKPRSLMRLGNKWYVGGIASLTTDRNIHVFSDSGTYERSLRVEGGSGLGGGASVYNGGLIRGLTTDGTRIIAVTSGGPPWVFEWTPQTNGASVPSYSVATRLPPPPGGGIYQVDGIAHDGTDLWVAVSWPQSGANRLSKHGLLKVNPAEDTLYRVNKKVDALARENGYLYALAKGEPSDLLRIKVGEGSTLQPYDATAAGTQMNDWEVVRRSVGIRGGLALRNGVAYGFNSARDEVRQARRADPTTAPTSPPVPTAPTSPTAPTTPISPTAPTAPTSPTAPTVPPTDPASPAS